MPKLSLRSAGLWTACRWRSNWPRPGVGVLSVEQIRDRLDDRFALLNEGDRTTLPRQRTLSAAIGWSYDLLGGTERELRGSLCGRIRSR
jgi:hypothetical protein